MLWLHRQSLFKYEESSLCTDVPLPSGKIGRGDSTDFSEGGERLYTGYEESFGEKCLSGELCIRDLLKFFFRLFLKPQTPREASFYFSFHQKS